MSTILCRHKGHAWQPATRAPSPIQGPRWCARCGNWDRTTTLTRSATALSIPTPLELARKVA